MRLLWQRSRSLANSMRSYCVSSQMHRASAHLNFTKSLRHNSSRAYAMLYLYDCVLKTSRLFVASNHVRTILACRFSRHRAGDAEMEPFSSPLFAPRVFRPTVASAYAAAA
jgi:hypothetical protein